MNKGVVAVSSIVEAVHLGCHGDSFFIHLHSNSTQLTVLALPVGTAPRVISVAVDRLTQDLVVAAGAKAKKFSMSDSVGGAPVTAAHTKSVIQSCDEGKWNNPSLSLNIRAGQELPSDPVPKASDLKTGDTIGYKAVPGFWQLRRGLALFSVRQPVAYHWPEGMGCRRSYFRYEAVKKSNHIPNSRDAPNGVVDRKS